MAELQLLGQRVDIYRRLHVTLVIYRAERNTLPVFMHFIVLFYLRIITPASPPRPIKLCRKWNQSVLQKRLGTTALHHCIWRFALHMLMYSLDAAARPWKLIQWSCSWANLKATWSWEVRSDWLCRKLSTSVHYALQHPLTPFHHFTWPTTSRLLFPITCDLL